MTIENQTLLRKAHLEIFACNPRIAERFTEIVSAHKRLRKLVSLANKQFKYENTSVDFENELFRLQCKVREHIEEIDHALERLNINFTISDKETTALFNRKNALGSEVIRRPKIPVHLGFLEPTRAVALAAGLPEKVAIFFVSITGESDLLTRENHGWGYHYHYLDRKQRRSDTLLTFQATERVSKDERSERVLTWERHAVKNSDFKARVKNWGDKKRENVHEACVLHSKNIELINFKKPSKDAEPLWPR